MKKLLLVEVPDGFHLGKYIEIFRDDNVEEFGDHMLAVKEITIPTITDIQNKFPTYDEEPKNYQDMQNGALWYYNKLLNQ